MYNELSLILSAIIVAAILPVGISLVFLNFILKNRKDEKDIYVSVIGTVYGFTCTVIFGYLLGTFRYIMNLTNLPGILVIFVLSTVYTIIFGYIIIYSAENEKFKMIIGKLMRNF